ncbi:hypothetical protein [Marilutibacter chinensis]|uniref:CHAT domain-containing protein n=1 Tax=Marilutibacter chinensis TaxID=2912247 RepID=A0ABS9HUF1_9GAMM|nr:hypothetical protein [Lysobacter chinensis]MCF7222516.1 hypothetical protein [Lysobacter chinensis]
MPTAGALALALLLAACGQAQRIGSEEEPVPVGQVDAASAADGEAHATPAPMSLPPDEIDAPAGRGISEAERIAEALPAGTATVARERALAMRAIAAAPAPAELVHEEDEPAIVPTAAAFSGPAEDLPVEGFRIGWTAGVSPRIDCPPDCAPVTTVARGRSYQLDVAVVDRALQARVSTTLEERLRELREDRALVVHLVPIFADGVSPAPGNGTTAYPLVLRKPSPPPSPSIDDEEAGTGADGTGSDDAGADDRTDRVFGRQSIPFLVNAYARGCAQIVLSVWNEEMTIALDGLVVTMPIDGFFGQTSCRDPSDRERRLQAPVVKSMADVVDVLDRPAGVADDASHVGLHVFEVGASRGDSYAVMVVQPRDGERQVAGWRLVSSIEDAFRANAEFQRRVVADRGYLSQAERGHWAYQKAAKFIKDKLFSAQASSQLPGMSAEQAFAALKALAESDDETVVSAQFFVPGRGGDSERMYLPLRMLAAPGSQLITNDFTLVEPISVPGALTPGCVSRWHVLVGRSVAHDLPDEHKRIVDRIVALPPTDWRNAALTGHTQVEAFFAGTAGTPPSAASSAASAPAGAEGIILVAHYGSDGIEIERGSGEVIDMEDIRRRFAPGSAAFLAACNTASPNASNGLIQRLHRHNVESFIASPLSVPTDYALVLTEQLINDIDRAYYEGDTPTLQALYAQAVATTERRYSETNGFVGDGHLHREYVLIGDPSVRLCPRPRQPDPEHEDPEHEERVEEDEADGRASDGRGTGGDPAET